MPRWWYLIRCIMRHLPVSSKETEAAKPERRTWRRPPWRRIRHETRALAAGCVAARGNRRPRGTVSEQGAGHEGVRRARHTRVAEAEIARWELGGHHGRGRHEDARDGR